MKAKEINQEQSSFHASKLYLYC